MRLLSFIGSILFVLNIQFVSAQAKKDSTQVAFLSDTKSNKIVLRWIPENPAIWDLGKKHGYTLIRYVKGKNIAPKKLLVNAKIQNRSFWTALAKTDDYAKVVEQMLFMPQPKVSKEEQQNAENYLFFFCLLSANMSAKVAQGLSLSYVDSTAITTEKYLYKLSITADNGQTLFETSLSTDLSTSYPQVRPVIEEFSFLDSATTIKFNPEQYMAYFLYRSDDNGVSYKKRSKAPFVPTYEENEVENKLVGFRDTITNLYQNYYYRFVGVTPFGEESTPSAPIKIFAYNTDLPSPLNPYFLPTNKGGVVLFWEYPDSLLQNIKGFDVIKTAKVEDNFGLKLNANMLPKNTRQYIDSKPETEGIYRIVATDIGDRVITSTPIIVQLQDTMPPLKPQNIKGTINKQGHVVIHWNPNQERDLYGYRVFMTNNLKEPFQPISKTILKDTIFRDTVSLSMLDKYIYYMIYAIDNHLNLSENVDTLKLKRPDIIKPTPPAIAKFMIADTLVRIDWLVSPSEDVVRYAIYRETMPDTTKTILKEFEISHLDSIILDSTVVEGTHYRYTIEAFDDSDNSSGKLCNLELKTPIPFMRAPVRQWSGKYNKQESAISLSWQKPVKKVKSYYLFRRVGEKDLKLYKQISAEETTFSELNWQPETLYGYCLIANFEDDTESKMTHEIVVKTPTKRK